MHIEKLSHQTNYRDFLKYGNTNTEEHIADEVQNNFKSTQYNY